MVRTQTVYFAYGSNLHLEQMVRRCPESRYVGLGKLHNYRWQINQRGYANIIPCPGRTVEGLCYLLSQEDERRLDASEGVPTAYQKHILEIEVVGANALLSGRRVREVHERIQFEIADYVNSVTQALDDDQAKERFISEGACLPWQRIEPKYHSGDAVKLNALVYVSTTATMDGPPRKEYIHRIASGEQDAISLGIDIEYFRQNVDEPLLGDYKSKNPSAVSGGPGFWPANIQVPNLC